LCGRFRPGWGSGNKTASRVWLRGIPPLTQKQKRVKVGAPRISAGWKLERGEPWDSASIDYSRTRIAVPNGTPSGWLFPLRGPLRQVFVAGVEVKATLQDLRLGM